MQTFEQWDKNVNPRAYTTPATPQEAIRQAVGIGQRRLGWQACESSMQERITEAQAEMRERIKQLEADKTTLEKELLDAVLKEHEASCDQCSIHIADLKAGYVGKLSEKFCDRHADLQRERERVKVCMAQAVGISLSQERTFQLPPDVLAALENTAAAMNMTPEKLLEQIVRERLMPQCAKT